MGKTQKTVGEFGDLFPIIVALLYSLQAVSLENKKLNYLQQSESKLYMEKVL